MSFRLISRFELFNLVLPSLDRRRAVLFNIDLLASVESRRSGEDE